ncbi:MAG: universal stress protein [Flavobacteriales bacterium]|nr:universal stress protein [Flavobacteriales bacterium]
MKTIILPTDFSDNAKNAIRFTIDMYGTENVRYVLVNAYGMHHNSSAMMINLDDVLHKDAETSMETEMNYILSCYKDKKPALSSVIRKGDLAEVIGVVFKMEKADMIAMGTKGDSGVDKVLMGSNTSHVIKMALCPVLAIPEGARYSKMDRLVFTTDLKKVSDASRQAIADVCKMTGARLDVVNVHDQAEVGAETERRMAEVNHMFSDVSHQIHTVQDDNVSEGINTFVEQNGADLIFMLAREESFFYRLFNPSHTRKMALHTEVPLLVLYEK